jgi:hypothetical protein
MNINSTRKHIRKERIQYIRLPPLEYFHQRFRTFTLSFIQIKKLQSIVIFYTVFPTNLYYIDKMEYIDKGASLGLPCTLTTIHRKGFDYTPSDSSSNGLLLKIELTAIESIIVAHLCHGVSVINEI